MHTTRRITSLLAATITTIVALSAGVPIAAGAATAPRVTQWPQEFKTGETQLVGQVPAVVSSVQGRSERAQLVGAANAHAQLSLNFGLPLHNITGLNALIVAEAKTHKQLSRAQIDADFTPPTAQYNALRTWLRSEGFTITHISSDHLEVTAHASVATVDRALRVNEQVFHTTSYKDLGVTVPAQYYYSNTSAAWVPTSLGVQTITGLNNVGQFFSDLQLAQANGTAAPKTTTKGSASPKVRSGGYYGRDLRSMYDVTNVDNSGTGQTIGFTLWGAAENQNAATAQASSWGDTAITVDANCTASGNSPTVPSSCSTQTVASNNLMSILENGNANNAYGGNGETGLDVEMAHGMAPGVAEKYYLGDCSSTPSPGLTNGNSCNGSDTGLEDAMEDAGTDPTLHSVSDSWAYGGDPEQGAADPFATVAENILALAAAAGTTFYFSTGDTGTYEAGFPSDSPYVVGVGGTSEDSTTAVSGTSTAVLSSSTVWDTGGSWCSNVFARPSWQTGASVTANADCPGRAIPDISADADTSTSIKIYYSTSATGDSSESVGGTSVAAPIMNGLEADTENFIAAQTYPGATPAIGFEGPIMYELGNSGNEVDYYRNVVCGNDADPVGSPDGESAMPGGWNQAAGWGEVDWLHYATGYAMELGAEGLTQPSALENYQWGCVQTPGNSTQDGVSMPTTSVGYSVGSATSTNWATEATGYSTSVWPAEEIIYKTTNGGSSWWPVNGDLFDVACTSSTHCVEVGDGGVIRETTNGGTTWTLEPTSFRQGLTTVACPTSTECFAAGDRGTVLESTNGGASWSFSASVDGNPIYGITCPDANTCYTVDNYGEIMATTNGGASWALQQTPVTSDEINVPGSGGPNPYSGFFGISCVSDTTCVAVGGYLRSGQTNQPIVETSNGGATWTLETSGDTTSADYLEGAYCIPGSTTCFAVGNGGKILESTDLATWTTMTSGTTDDLSGITCSSTTSCVATGQAGVVDVYNGTSWTVSTSTIDSSAFLHGVSCSSATSCIAVGHQGTGVTFNPSSFSGSLSQLEGGGYTSTIDAVSCSSATTCEVAGASGTVLGTTNGGQTWTAQTSGLTTTIDGISCVGSDCAAVGASGKAIATTNGGSTWTAESSGETGTISAISCVTTNCVAVGASGAIITSANNGATWTTRTSGTTAALTGVSCYSTNCYAVGAETIDASTNSGATWATQTSNVTQSLTAISCVNAYACFAGGALGTVDVTTNGGATWAQQGDPLSGPLTALNTTGPTSELAITSVSCEANGCFMGGDIGNIMTTPLVTVTVNEFGTAGTAPSTYLSGLSATSSGVTVSPNGDASLLSGTLNCTTSATSSSPAGASYPLTGCSGLSAAGYNVVYDLADSSYSAVSAPTAVISSPATGNTYTLGQSVTTSFSCMEATAGPGIASCTDNNGGSGTSGTLNTSSLGTFTYTVTATSTDGQTGTASISYSVEPDLPVATITSPASGGTYAVGQSVSTSFSCSEGTDGPGIATCTDSNGGSGTSGTLNTSSLGTFTYTVTATSSDGETGTASITYTVAAAPSATISSPATDGVYVINQVVPTAFGCTEGTDGPGIASCSDSNGGSGTSGTLDTSSTGTFSYTVTATSSDGQTGTASISYTVIAAAPTAIISSPASGGTYAVGQSVSTSFSCVEGTAGTGISSCTDNNGGSGTSGTLDTSSTGTFTYTVTATSSDGQTGTASITYTVAAAPTATIASPSSGGIYAVGQSVSTSYGCSEGTDGPGIATCTDTNGGSGTSGTLDTSSVGTFTYTVTATSSDGQTGTASITYTVAAAPTATITSPATGGIYAVGQSVSTNFNCADGTDGPGIATCTDTNGGSGTSGTLDTSSTGTFTYTVTATSTDGQTGTASITYTVAAAPTATITSPATGGIYAVGQSVSTTFSCSEGTDGPGIASCTDTNGGSGTSGTLDTSSTGTFTYTVTATSADGQTGSTSITYTVANAPAASITTPASGGIYAVGQSVATTFLCTDGTDGPGIASCTDSNGGSGTSGTLDTSSLGTFTYTVTATSSDGQTGTASITYTVAGAPTATITSPATGGTFSVGESVPTSFGCTEGANGPGIASCTDTNGGSGTSGVLDTSSLGTHTYTVTATSSDGQTGTASITYTVANGPAASITTPASGGIYAVGQSVATTFLCTDGAYGPGISSCTDTNGGSGTGGTLDTSSTGTFTYTVTATSADGQVDHASITYTVAAAPSAAITSPASGGTYAVGQSVSTTFSCTDGASGPGIASCTDNNGGSGTSGTLDTSSTGTFTYTVTATSSDGQTNTASITYTVAAAPTATITSPSSGGIYAVGQLVSTSYGCSEGTDGPGIASCTDSNGGSGTSGTLDTSSVGTFTYTVTATSSDGQTGTASITYVVAAAPSATITSPSSGGIYAVGQSVSTAFNCTDGTDGPGIATCTDSNGGSGTGGTLATSSLGTHTYTVTATSSDGQTGTASITYTVAAAPAATITSPAGGGIYAVGQSVSTTFSCSEGTDGPGIASCADSHGGSGTGGTLNTSSTGTHTYTVTATSSDGQTGTASITYTVAAAPTAAISSPASGGTYAVNQVVATSFRCSEGASGPGIASCTDSHGGSGTSGTLNTSTLGTHTYTVTATSSDGQTGTASITYTVAAAPFVTIASPSSGGIYAVGQSVSTRFSCTEGTDGTGLASCKDSNGTSGGAGHLNTSTAGQFTYGVTATSLDGQTTTISISYTVAAAPTVTITPATGGTDALGATVTTHFTCADGSFGPGIASCVDSHGSTSGTGSLPTNQGGSFTYSVTATSRDGQVTTDTIHYTVAKGTATTTLTGTPGAETGLVTYHVAVSGVAGITPGGSVTVSDGTSTCTVTLVSGAGSCALAEGVGRYSVTAHYGGSTSYNASSGHVTEVVAKATPRMTVTYRQPNLNRDVIIYTVTVDANGGIYPTGSVVVSDGHRTCQIDSLTNGTGTCRIGEPTGTFRAGARYSGDSNYRYATAGVTVTVQ